MQNGGCHPVDGCYFPEAPYAGARFQWLAANVVDGAGQTPLPPYWIKRVNNVEVAFIGMTLEATDTLVAAAGIQGWNFHDEAATANALVPVLKAQGVEAIIVLLHEGGSQTPPPGDINACVGISGPIVAIHDALDPAIDAIVTGHTHLPYNCRLTDAAGQPRIVTSAYSYGRVVSELKLVLDKRTKDVRRDLSTATNHLVDQTALAPNPVQSAIIAKWQPLVDAAGSTPVGTITADIVRGGTPPGTTGRRVAGRQPGRRRAALGDVVELRRRGVHEPGGRPLRPWLRRVGGRGRRRGDLRRGLHLPALREHPGHLPDDGAQIVSVLEEQCQPAGSSRPFLHLGVSAGFTYDLAKTIVTGNCTSVTVSNVKLNGVALDPAATYQVTVNNFLADGGDNFGTFATVTAPRLDGGNDLQALVNYLGTFSPVAPPPTDRVNELP